jgi:hypothetical protein
MNIDMKLPNNFIFNQSNMQDFVECRRRFYLRHIRKIKWPAIQSEPFLENERFSILGSSFHRGAHQFFLGIDQLQIADTLQNDELNNWWHNFITFIEQNPEITTESYRIFPEHILSTYLSGFRLSAKYDLICVFPDGRIKIYDWKTSRAPPKIKWLENKLQTIVYPFLVHEACETLQITHLPQSDSIELIYWFASFPEDTIKFQHNHDKHTRSKKYLKDLISLIQRLAEAEDEQAFPKVEDVKRCAFCEFRSLCNTGIKAGSGEENDLTEEQDLLELSFDQIAEISIE